MRHPYTALQPYQRWSSAMARTPAADVDPVVRFPFRIGPGDRVATAGSCFAQHLGRGLRAHGLEPLVTETAHPLVPPEAAEALGYGVYTARFGNIYTARQLLQLIRRAYGRFQPAEDAWEGADGRAIDPFRPAIQPGGFASRRELRADREQHFAAVRAMAETADVLVFTLGLTETWASAQDGAVFPVCPGVAGGRFDPQRHMLLNLGVEETVADLAAALADLRAVNPGLRLILTVSPVPLAATAEPQHVWTSTTFSKAVLRVAADTLSRGPGAAYFPSYEVITSPAARGRYFADDLRQVTEAGVDHVLRLFFRHVCTAELEGPAPPPGESWLGERRAAIDVICEEAALDPG